MLTSVNRAVTPDKKKEKNQPVEKPEKQIGRGLVSLLEGAAFLVANEKIEVDEFCFDVWGLV